MYFRPPRLSSFCQCWDSIPHALLGGEVKVKKKDINKTLLGEDEHQFSSAYFVGSIQLNMPWILHMLFVNMPFKNTYSWSHITTYDKSSKSNYYLWSKSLKEIVKLMLFAWSLRGVPIWEVCPFFETRGLKLSPKSPAACGMRAPGTRSLVWPVQPSLINTSKQHLEALPQIQQYDTLGIHLWEPIIVKVLIQDICFNTV